MDITLAVATGLVSWEAIHVFWKGYQYVTWEGRRVGENTRGTKYLCGNGVNSFLRCIIRNTGAAGATGGKWLMASASYGRRIVRKIRPGVSWWWGANWLEGKTRCLLMLERGCRLMLRFRKSGKSEVSRDNAGVFPDRKVRNRKSFVSSSLGRFGAWEYHHSIRVKNLDRLSLSELFQLTHTWLPHAPTLGPNPGIENRLYLLP